jgi:hypothetical protein
VGWGRRWPADLEEGEPERWGGDEAREEGAARREREGEAATGEREGRRIRVVGSWGLII